MYGTRDEWARPNQQQYRQAPAPRPAGIFGLGRDDQVRQMYIRMLRGEDPDVED